MVSDRVVEALSVAGRQGANLKTKVARGFSVDCSQA
ncbi:MAG: hypothetical protein ACJATT_003041, partial [Myxococcota bacterium]